MFKGKVIVFSLLAACLVIPGVASAAEPDTKLKETELLEIKGETVELETWVDPSGEEIYTIPTQVEDKQAVINYMENYLTEEEKLPSVKDRNKLQNTNIVTPQQTGPRTPFSRSKSNTDSLGKVYWSTGGYSERSLYKPVTPDKMRVNDGTVKISYTGSGNADKIVSSYSYVFDGITIGISYPPTLSKSSKTVSWKSQPVTKQWYVTHKSLWTEATSRTNLYGVTLTAAADIYKGSRIYRPRATSEVTFGLK